MRTSRKRQGRISVLRIGLLAQQRTLHVVRQTGRDVLRRTRDHHRPAEPESEPSTLQRAVAFNVDCSEGRTEFASTDAGSVEELAPSMPLRERIRGVLKSGSPRTSQRSLLN